MNNRAIAALAGALAAGAALATGEALSGISDRVPSLTLAVADVFVDETPGGLVRWSIDTFGASQKTTLVWGIVIVSLLLGALFGLLAQEDFWRGAAGFGVFGIVGGWAGARLPLASDLWAWVTAVLAVAVGIGTLWAMLRWSAEEAPADEPADDAAVAAMRIPGPATRRNFLVAAGLTATWGLVGTGFGRSRRNARNVEEVRAEVADQFSGDPQASLSPAGVETFDTSVDGISPLVTPNDDFYRIDTALLTPQVDPGDWSLKVTGMVDNEVEVTYDELLEMEQIEEYITIACVSNEVGGDLVGNALWTGVPLRLLLDRAGVHPDATQIVGRSVDRWTSGFPTEVAFDGRPCMVALGMNGEPLPVDHGFPARLMIPGLYGYVSATKWLAEIELTTWEGFDSYWVPRGWAKEGPIKTQSRIDVPKHGDTVDAGRQPVAGVAWAPHRSVAKVEVRVGEGDWQEARLSGALSGNTWVQWVFDWDAEPGEHVLQVRATDGMGETQTSDKAPPAPDGATGYHTVRVEVAD